MKPGEIVTKKPEDEKPAQKETPEPPSTEQETTMNLTSAAPVEQTMESMPADILEEEEQEVVGINTEKILMQLKNEELR